VPQQGQAKPTPAGCLDGRFSGSIVNRRSERYRLERQGQISERFTRAIEQLGHKERDVRLGGIYALEGIAKDSKEYHGPIMEVLTAYVREHAPWPRPTDKGQEAVSPEHRERDEDGAPATDVQAVIAVLGRRVLGRKGEHVLDLRSVDLRQARFGKGADEGHFELANFAGAQLQGAVLDGVHLTGAHFERANLGGKANLVEAASLAEANLTKADLTMADLGLAVLMRAILCGANFQEANLTRATLWYANLTGAKLVGAYLTGANLTEAHLAGASFMGADGANLTGAVYDSETTWPTGFDPKAEGAHLIRARSVRASPLPSARRPSAQDSDTSRRRRCAARSRRSPHDASPTPLRQRT
jgi:uncharacterized protein YjbI with pentapeptide repeats